MMKDEIRYIEIKNCYIVLSNYSYIVLNNSILILFDWKIILMIIDEKNNESVLIPFWIFLSILNQFHYIEIKT